MALYFHEGLPGAGKSYEAVVYHILPALKAGRQVITNIRGVNAEKLAELLGEPLEYIQILLIYIEPAEQDGEASDIEKVKDAFANETPDNAMIVWDEIQDYFPSGNYKLPIHQQKFWTEHRHRGLDIIIMGQDRDDVHKIIRSRIEAITYFLKLKAVGQPDKYKWEHYEKQSKGKFVKIGAGVRNYESKYFGSYASHRREGIRSKVYTTDRTNVLTNTKALSLGVPAAFVAGVFAIYHLWGFFHPEPVETTSPMAVSSTPTAGRQYPIAGASPPASEPQQSAADGQDQDKPEPIDYLDRLAQQHLIRASAVLTSDTPGRELMGFVEILDSNYRKKELFRIDEIQALGWDVTSTGYGLLLEKEGVKYVARPWPLDIVGRVDERTRNSLDHSHASAARGYGETPRREQTPVIIVPDSTRRPWH